MNWITKLFLPNDWKLIYSTYNSWSTFYGTIYYEGKQAPEVKNCFYHIYYSNSRNKFKIIVLGFRPKKHSHYNVVLQKLLELESQTNIKNNE